MTEVTINLPKKQIVVVTQGWVFAGDVYQEPGGVRIDNAVCVRSWGTEFGLGQLALQGPSDETILDAYGIIHVPLHSIVATVDCTGWTNIVPTKPKK